MSFGGLSLWYSLLLSDRCDKIGRGTLLIRGICSFGRLRAGEGRGGQGILGLLGSNSEEDLLSSLFPFLLQILEL